MSIYPVKLSEWFPRGDENYQNSKMMVKFGQCYKCGKKNIKYSTAFGHHSLPWGYGDIWCSSKCYRSKSKRNKKIRGQ